MSHSIRRYTTDVSERQIDPNHSSSSQVSQSTTPTSLYSSPSPSIRQDVYTKDAYSLSPCTTFYARSSTETYSSTVESLPELCEEPDTYDPSYEVPEYREVDYSADVQPSNPADFAEFFPSLNRLSIRHDDTTHDGNMNLRVDTERRRGTVQLFHLKMNDLKKREFSLRRYERSSGREVCHSARKFTQSSSEKRPPLSRSVSNAFASIVKPEFKRTSTGLSSHSKKSAKRQDSGYGSDEDYFDTNATPKKASTPIQIPSNTTKLEFSNYAQVDVKRRGAKSSKRYEFEYWGHQYAWKRVEKKDGGSKEVSYHLYKGDNGPAVAHIVPELRSPSQTRDEERNGGWVPPCSMWIADKSVLEALTDVAEYVPFPSTFHLLQT